MGSMRFMYLLPFHPNEGLIEYTLFSETLLSDKEYEMGLKSYIEGVLGIRDYVVIETESGVIPMTDHPFKRRLGERVLSIGTAGGLVKPSSGYAFLRILKDTEQIINSFKKHGHPFDITPPLWQYRLFDRTMLNVMKNHGSQMERIFSQLFKNNPIDRIFNFLDEADPLSRNLLLLLSIDPVPFLAALARVYLFRKT